ncbi:hypothetical protein [Serratia fonticola]
MKYSEKYQRRKLEGKVTYCPETGDFFNKDGSKKITPMLMGVSGNVAKALTMIDYKASPRPAQEVCEGGATRLPQVALFNAGHRKTTNVTAR